jgi:hypothetical protein
MGHILAQVRFARTSNVPEDIVVNTFHFRTTTAPVAADYTAIATKLESFYKDIPPASTSSLNGFASGLVATSGHEIRQYNMALPKPRAPSSSTTFTLPAQAGGNVPAELAICLSFRGPLLSGTNAARRRGRVYIGPLGLSAIGSAQGGDVRPSGTLMSVLANAGKALMDSTTAGDWSVFSEKDAVGSISPDAGLVTVTDLWVDNAFDIQRRRGAAPTTRETRTT